MGCPDGGPSEPAAQHDARAGARLRAAQCVPHAQSFGFRGPGLRASSHRDSVRGVACVPRRAPCHRGTGGVVGAQAMGAYKPSWVTGCHGAAVADGARPCVLAGDVRRCTSHPGRPADKDARSCRLGRCFRGRVGRVGFRGPRRQAAAAVRIVVVVPGHPTRYGELGTVPECAYPSAKGVAARSTPVARPS